MGLVKTECDNLITTMGFFNFRVTKLFKIQEFVNTQEHATSMDSVRSLLYDSLRSFARLIVDACLATTTVRPNFHWGDSLIHSHFPPAKAPIFALDLVLDDKGAHFNCDPDALDTSLVGLFNGAVHGTWNIYQLERFIMQDISWSESPFLEAVDKDETIVRELRETMRDAIKSSLIPLKAYAKKYEEFLPIVHLDIRDYISDLENQGLTPKELEQEVLKHLKERTVTLNKIPYSIVIGPYQLNMEGVRDLLAAKRKELAMAILGIIVRNLRKKVDNVLLEYRDIRNGLSDAPSCIEDLFQLRDWITEVPNMLEGLQETANVILAEYEILDEYSYCLSEDDFTTKITMVSWPLKIQDMCEKKLAVLDEDEDRYLRQLESDVITLSERLDNNQA
ncbi:dynein heavy chain 1, axonemal-like [Plakobranchus ocellatus]|uniref:Dynein heavy chain 1, axonemal-like n=1 Tax=Plakobranchus ocellatus TaxID=259542 RepID=A0AAV4DMZ0_9GAST|nr:dynein heavy chain 1, axonemal-like [Plakobranchus ocellatus]